MKTTTDPESYLSDYPNNGKAYDEAFDRDQTLRAPYRTIMEHFDQLSENNLTQREKQIQLSLLERGVTFDSEAGQGEPATETLTVDPIPRVIQHSEWEDFVKPGLKQRVTALNLFLNDIYQNGKILKDDVIPTELVRGKNSYHRRLHGIRPPGGVYTHIAGVDLVRDEEGQFRVLEDNLQIPSGVSYMLQNRRILLETFPRLVNKTRIRSVNHYPDLLLESLRSLSDRPWAESGSVLLTPGPYNSAYFEHVFLARKMGIELVKGEDLYVEDEQVWMDRPQGPQRVDVIYRRIDTEYLDPAAFKSDSLLGVPGLIDAYQAGNVLIANAPGCGVADDKAIYSYVPKIIQYYLNEDPILPNVKTYLGRDREDRQYIEENAQELTIKRVDGAGGYGMLIGPKSSQAEINSYMKKFRSDPEKYIAQPTIDLSTHPCLVDDGRKIEPRHIDLRPFVIYGSEGPTMVPGGLTRVALERNSLVVNSSQGGGSKDTWIVG